MTSIEPAKPIKLCDHVRKLPRGVEHYRSRSSFLISIASAVAQAERALEDAWQRDQAAHAENESAIAHNKEMRGRLIAMMKAAGVPDSYSAVDPKSRRWPQKHKTLEAGYLGDLRRTFPLTDQFDDAGKQYADRAKLIADAKVKVEEEKAAKDRQAEAEKAKRRADLSLAAMIVRYGLNEDADWPDALEALRKRNKYLDLAIAGEQTRGDWSEGFYRVENALRRFTIESDRDKDIVADLCGCLRGDQDDGRIFRDTTWSYGKLFELVTDAQLLADAKTCLEHEK
ncbi:hypothetical protein UFOVP860_66 [uncultured Caudovirales phage]|uniref:Uncharacterized protein n=1 Tax=uncultured Caudovirales phage TaxID=2100421 RepID=A0A6J5P9X3_9CAUD|nr:hypothetical protein UFOVP860_66 [uncultured Caudovirales phage]CAB4195602.1 hypothetical protein UFOVP1293_45 [uncultured Caudovirales phage]CAB4222557.1 hypothetical protein UFOVP1644_63 [uncultured Caudovirales phage]